MPSAACFWTYLIAASLLIAHEIDSAFWREWELFRLPFTHGGFVLVHVPLVGVLLLGAVEVRGGTSLGAILGWLTATGGVFAFGIHSYFIRRGRPEFTAAASRGILWALLVSSLALAAQLLLAALERSP